MRRRRYNPFTWAHGDGYDTLTTDRAVVVINTMLKSQPRRRKRKEYEYIVMVGRLASYGMTPGLKRWDYLGQDGNIYSEDVARDPNHYKYHLTRFPTREDAAVAAERFVANLERPR